MIVPTDTLAGRREAALLGFASVRRMAETLAARCRAASWVRTSIASLERFRGHDGQPGPAGRCSIGPSAM